MKCKINVLSLFTKNPPGVVVSTVAKHSGLSPFLCGPCNLYKVGLVHKTWQVSLNMENGWQYSKVYPEHIDQKGDPTKEYFAWAESGWANPKAVRYPMGKGRKPRWSWWDGERLDYIQARKQIYVPLYAEAVQKTEAYTELVELYKSSKEITLLDYDAYDHRKCNLSLTEVLNNPHQKMGHAFVLAMLLTNDPALKQCALRS